MTRNWDEATSTLIGHALPVVRVTESDEGNITIVWRQPPTDEQKEKADSLLIGAAPNHAW